jgi:HK97 family phage prohead protease
METFYKYGRPVSEIKDVDLQKRTVQAYYYNSQTVDSDNDIILPGAYAKSIKERGPKSPQPRIKHLYNHWDGAGLLMELGEDEKGGWFLSKLGRHTIGRDVLTMYDDGLITEHSHGFEVMKTGEERIEDKDVRVIKEGVLWEVTSLDKWGANQNTPVIKSKDDASYWIKKLDKLQKAFASGSYSDETFELLELQLKQIQQLISEFDMKPEQPPTPPRAGGQPTSTKMKLLKIKNY